MRLARLWLLEDPSVELVVAVTSVASRIVQATMMMPRGLISIVILALWCCVSAQAAGSSSKLQVHVSIDFLLRAAGDLAISNRSRPYGYAFNLLSHRYILDD